MLATVSTCVLRGCYRQVGGAHMYEVNALLATDVRPCARRCEPGVRQLLLTCDKYLFGQDVGVTGMSGEFGDHPEVDEP